jgi:hypothetical protein
VFQDNFDNLLRIFKRHLDIVGKLNEELAFVLMKEVSLKDVVPKVKQKYHLFDLVYFEHIEIHLDQVVQLLESLLHCLPPNLAVVFGRIERLVEYLKNSLDEDFSRQILIRCVQVFGPFSNLLFEVHEEFVKCEET